MDSATVDMITGIDEILNSREWWARSLTNPDSGHSEYLVEFHLETDGRLDEIVQAQLLGFFRENMPTPRTVRLYLSSGCGDYCGEVYAIKQTAKATQ